MMTRRARVTVFLIAVVQKQLVALAFDALDPPVGNFDAGGALLFLHLDEQGLLHVRLKLQAAFESHLGRIGVDRFRFGKICDRGKNLGCFKNGEAQPGFLRFDRRGNSRNARPNDCEIKRLGISVSRSLKIGLLQNRANSTRAGIGGKFQQRNAGQVADDPHSWQSGRAVFSRIRQLLDRAGGPLGVQPMRVTCNQSGHKFTVSSLLSAFKIRKLKFYSC